MFKYQFMGKYYLECCLRQPSSGDMNDKVLLIASSSVLFCYKLNFQCLMKYQMTVIILCKADIDHCLKLQDL